MKTVFLVVGRTTDRHFAAGIEEYAARIGRYMPFQIETVPELRDTKHLSEGEQKEREAQLIMKSLSEGDYLVLLDEHGTERRSIEFARWLEKRLASAPRRLVFLVGGPYGFAPAVYERANEQISLSRMTLSHQMVRLLFTEQLYRALTILRGEPYHHE